MKKYILDLVLRRKSLLQSDYVLLQLTHPAQPLPPMQAGQFVEVRVDASPQTFLRRPISINYVDCDANELWLLVHTIGAGTRALAALEEGSTLNCVFPLGNGFTLPSSPAQQYLLVGGGVGVAPLLYLGHEIRRMGGRPTFLLGARSANDLLQLDLFEQEGEVFVTTEDGSAGEKGFVTQHSLWQSRRFDAISTCGPKPMMQAVARLAQERGIPCEASLENMMACGLGACLCCVEATCEGNLCVCTEGPVFDTRRLKW